MKTYKPDLNEKISMRMSVAMKRELNELCRLNDLDESIVARTVLEAGIALAKERGFHAIMDKRTEVVVATPKPKPVPSARPLYIIEKPPGNLKWVLKDPTGMQLNEGTLYHMRPIAKKICPEGCGVEIHFPDGVREKLV